MLSGRMTVDKTPWRREMVDKNNLFCQKNSLIQKNLSTKRDCRSFFLSPAVFLFSTVDKFFISDKNFQHFFGGRLSSNLYYVCLKNNPSLYLPFGPIVSMVTEGEGLTNLSGFACGQKGYG